MPTPGKFAVTSVRYGCAFLLGFAASRAIAQTPASVAPAVAAQTYSAPLELIHDKPYASVMVNGRGPYRFLIDTGTGTEALVTPELAGELHLSAVGHARLTDPSRQGEQRSETTRIETLVVAGAEFSEVDAVVHNLYGETNCQGVLGFPLFEDYLLTLDFPGRRLLLTQGEIDPLVTGSILPFRMPDGVPLVSLEIGDRQFEAQIDSGGTGLSLPERALGELKFRETPMEFALGESVSTRFEIKAARLQPDVRLGRYTFRQAFVEINAAFPLANIGSTPLQHFVVTFDQARQLVGIYSSEETLHLDASPVLMRMLNAPKLQRSDNNLVPIGF